MDETNQLPPPAHLQRLVDSGAVDDAVMYLTQPETASVDDRKAALQALRSHAEQEPTAVTPLVSLLAAFLTDTERPVRLSTAKLFVTLAAADPEAVVDSVPALADRLADDEEFYYVRARAAEALGYVAVEYPDVAATPEILADLRIGLSFDKPEVKQKLAKALAFVALGNPRRLRHHVTDLADHLDSDDELVRYHLTTALVAVGCEHPEALSEVVDTLADLLDDSSPYIRGRAAEALGVIEHVDIVSRFEIPLSVVANDTKSFAADRAQFALAGRGTNSENEIGAVETIREQTDEIVETITTPDGDECPHCGLAGLENGPPMCPRCGSPY